MPVKTPVSKSATKTASKSTTASASKPAVKAETPQLNGETKKASTRLKVAKTYKIYIGGQFPRTESGRYYDLKLADGSVVNMCLGSRKDVRNAVSAARNAQAGWAGKTAYNKSQILYRMGEMLEGRSAQFVEELKLMSSSAAEAQKEVEEAVDCLVYYAGWCDKFQQVYSNVNPVTSSHFNFSQIEPTGVVTVICDENSGLLGLVNTIAPIIASGNTCVVLASTSKPLCAVSFAEVLNSSDLPGGVVNIITGTRKELLSHLANHMDVNAIYLHSSNQDEIKTVQTLCALNVKRSTIDQTANWPDENPERILEFTEVKTTWHPVGI